MGACDAGRTRTGAPRPGKRRAVRLSRVGSGEDERFSVLGVAELAKPLDSAGKGELRAAETLDEVAATADADRLERAQLRVDGAVAAGDALAADAVPGDDALALQQELGQRAPVARTFEQP